MNDVKPFLAKIRTGDAECVGVLADWLEGQGDPRAAEVRAIYQRYRAGVQAAFRPGRRLHPVEWITRSIYWAIVRTFKLMKPRGGLRGRFDRGRVRGSPLWLKAVDMAMDVAKANRPGEVTEESTP